MLMHWGHTALQTQNFMYLFSFRSLWVGPAQKHQQAVMESDCVRQTQCFNIKAVQSEIINISHVSGHFHWINIANIVLTQLHIIMGYNT